MINPIVYNFICMFKTIEGEHSPLYRQENSHGNWVPTLVTFMGGIGLAGLLVIGACEAQAAQSRNYIEGKRAYLSGLLNGQIPLNQTEKKYPRVEVVPAGNSLAERIAMKNSGKMVNVREYPGTFLPNGVETNVVGRIPQGETLDSVILTPGAMPNSPVMGFWGALDCSKDTPNGAKIIWDPNFPQPTGFRVCTIYEDYLGPVK